VAEDTGSTTNDRLGSRDVMVVGIVVSEPQRHVQATSHFLNDLGSIAFTQTERDRVEIALYSSEYSPIVIARIGGIDRAREIHDSLPEWIKPQFFQESDDHALENASRASRSKVLQMS